MFGPSPHPQWRLEARAGSGPFNYMGLSGHEPPETRGEAIVSGPAAARWKLNINLNICSPTGMGGGGVRVNARIACLSESGPDTCQSPGRLMATGRCLFQCSAVATSSSSRWLDLCRGPVVGRSSSDLSLLLLQHAAARLCLFFPEVFRLPFFFPHNLMMNWQQESAAGGQVQSHSFTSQTSR